MLRNICLQLKESIMQNMSNCFMFICLLQCNIIRKTELAAKSFDTSGKTLRSKKYNLSSAWIPGQRLTYLPVYPNKSRKL